MPIHVKFHWFTLKIPLLLWPWQRSNWSGWWMLGNSSIGVFTLMMKIFKSQSWQFGTLTKFSNLKTFYDHGDLKNKVKVNLMTCNKRFCHYASWVEVSSLYLKRLLHDLWAFVYQISYNGKIKLYYFPHNWGPSDLIFGVYRSTMRLPGPVVLITDRWTDRQAEGRMDAGWKVLWWASFVITTSIY